MSKSKTIITSTTSLSRIIDAIRLEMGESAPSKQTLLNIAAREIAGEKQNWGFLTNAKGVVVQQGLPEARRIELLAYAEQQLESDPRRTEIAKSTPYAPHFDFDDTNDNGMQEGWGLFHTDSDGEDSTLRLMCDDEAEDIESDDEAIAHVIARASQGSELHLSALFHLKNDGSVDFARVIQSATEGQRTALAAHGILA